MAGGQSSRMRGGNERAKALLSGDCRLGKTINHPSASLGAGSGHEGHKGRSGDGLRCALIMRCHQRTWGPSTRAFALAQEDIWLIMMEEL